MTTLVVTTAATTPAPAAPKPAAAAPKQPKMKIRGVVSGQAMTVLFAPQTGNASGVAPVYQRQPRPGRKDAVNRTYEATKVLALDLTFRQTAWYLDVENNVQWLTDFASHEEAFTLEGVTPKWAGPWWITELTWDFLDLQPGTNKILHAVAHTTFTEAVGVKLPTGPVAGGVGSGTKKPAPKPAAGSTKSKSSTKSTTKKQRTYTVKKGDTLSGIAAKELHDASRWREIATLNHLRNPNLIFPGQVLKLP